jgi:hypothetical protein
MFLRFLDYRRPALRYLLPNRDQEKVIELGFWGGILIGILLGRLLSLWLD